MKAEEGTPRAASAQRNPGLLAVGFARIAVGAVSIASTSLARALERAAADATGPSTAAPAEGDRPEVAGSHPADAPRRDNSPLKRVPGFSQLEARTAGLTRFIRDERARSEATAARFFAAVFPEMTEAFLNNLDLTKIVVQGVDLDRVVQEVDVEAVVERADLNAVASRIDIDAVIDRIDLVGIARYLMDELELPEIIRESTGALAVESMEQLRVQGIRADRFVAHVFDRIVRRKAERRVSGPPAGPSGSVVPDGEQ
jgi:hypothetical protein